jgi:hypothetical protein
LLLSFVFLLVYFVLYISIDKMKSRFYKIKFTAASDQVLNCQPKIVILNKTFYGDFMTYHWHFTAKKHRPRWFLAKTRCACCITARSYVLSAILLMMSTFILLLLYMYCYNRLNRNTQKSFVICLTFFVFIKIDLIALLSFCYVYIFPSLR